MTARSATIPRVTAAAATPTTRIRWFSSTPGRPTSSGHQDKDAVAEAEAEAEADERPMSVREVMADLDIGHMNMQERMELERELSQLFREADEATLPERNVRNQFWNEEEEDPDMMIRDGVEEENPGDEMTTMAHSKLDEIREQRERARVIAWEMPLLASMCSRPRVLFLPRLCD